MYASISFQNELHIIFYHVIYFINNGQENTHIQGVYQNVEKLTKGYGFLQNTNDTNLLSLQEPHGCTKIKLSIIKPGASDIPLSQKQIGSWNDLEFK